MGRRARGGWQRAGKWIAARPAAPALALAALALLVQAALYWRFTVDDAFITLRCARNLAEGYGPVFNHGERVEGYSSPLLVLILGGLGRLGLPYLVAAKGLGLAAAAGTLAVVYEVGRRAAGPRRGALAVLLAATSLPFTLWAVNGMETPLHALAVAWGLLAFVRRRALTSGLAWGVAALTRPEAPLLALALLPWWGRRAPRYLAGLGGVLTLLLAWRLAYYGDWLPNTFYAKATGPLPLRLQRGVAYLWEWVWPDRLVWAGALLVCLVPLLEHRRRWQAGCLAVAGAQLVFVLAAGGDWMPGWRFLVPVLPVLALLAAGSAPARVLRPAAAVMVIVGLAGPSAWTARMEMARVQQTYGATHSPMRLAGDWLERHAAGCTAAASQMGVLPWHCPRLTVIDLAGLTDRHIARLPGALNVKCDPAYLRRRRPDFVVLSVRDKEPFFPSERTWWARRGEWLAGYRPVCRFHWYAHGRPVSSLVIYRRATLPGGAATPRL